MLIILVLGITSILVSNLSKVTLNSERNIISNERLSQSKEALIGFLLKDMSVQPPNPDVMDSSTESPANYNGNFNNGCFDNTKPPSYMPLTIDMTNRRCVGRLPWQTLGMSISSPSDSDPLGTMPWYAFSRNLVDSSAIVNPDWVNSNNYPWLTVRDMKGNILSNRVAFVIIIPGTTLAGKSRPGGPDQYLDNITVPSGCASPCIAGTYSNADLDESYIMGDEHRWIDDPSNTGKQIEDPNYQFNDKLVYVTIDELMAKIVSRAAGEARTILNKYYSAQSQFPDAASLGSSGTFSPVPSNDSGMLPIDLGSCSCSSAASCSCNYKLVASIAFKRGSTSTWSTNSGACTKTTTQTCTCTGVGQCRNSSGSRTFSCDSVGNCNVTNGTSGKFIFIPPTYANLAPNFAGCTYSGNNVECTGVGSFDTKLNFPNWFTIDNWQDFFYYHRSNTSALQAGNQTGIKALLIGTGAAISSSPFTSKGSAQSRPSNNINDYLDSPENTNQDLKFDATSQLFSSSYNDQTFIIAP